MSQAKVDRYKEEKRNRAKLIKKAKRLTAIAVVMIGWVGMSVYTSIENSNEDTETLETYTLNASALDDYINGLSAE